MEDDLNTPKALSVLWGVLRDSKKTKQFLDLINEFDRILALDLDVENIREILENKEKEFSEELPEDIKELIAKRTKARVNKDWTESDRLRDELTSLGYTVKDSKEGMTIEKQI